jgi:hypothetical protein
MSKSALQGPGYACILHPPTAQERINRWNPAGLASPQIREYSLFSSSQFGTRAAGGSHAGLLEATCVAARQHGLQQDAAAVAGAVVQQEVHCCCDGGCSPLSSHHQVGGLLHPHEHGAGCCQQRGVDCTVIVVVGTVARVAEEAAVAPKGRE